MTSYYVEEGCEAFRLFISLYHDPEVLHSEAWLDTLLAEWLDHGRGVEYTAATYDHFLQVAVAVADRAVQGKLRLDYTGPQAAPYRRQLAGLIEPDVETSVLTRTGYDQLAHELTEERRLDVLGRVVRESLLGRQETAPVPTVRRHTIT